MEGQFFKDVFRSGKEKREIKVEKRREMERGHHCFDYASSALLPSEKNISQRNIDHIQAPNELWLSIIIKKETEWTIIWI